MQVTVLTGMAGYPAYQPGEVIDLPPAIAREWIEAGYARGDAGPTALDAPLTALHERHQRQRADLLRRRRLLEDKRREAQRAHFREWEGRRNEIEWNEAEHPDRDAYQAACERLTREVAALNAQIREVDLALDEFPRRYERERASIAASTVVGGPIAVPPLPAFDVDDPQIASFEAERTALLAELERTSDDRTALEQANREHATYVRLVATRVRVRLASADDLKAAEAEARAAGKALAKIEDRMTEISRRLEQLATAIDERRAVVQRERDRRVETALRTVAAAAARDLVAAMASMTAYLRLRQLSESDLPGFEMLDADQPRSAGREWLQGLIDAGLLPADYTS